MKTISTLTIFVTTVASAAVAPALGANDITERHVHIPDTQGPTVDETSTRGKWVSSYRGNKVDGEAIPTVDETSGRDISHHDETGKAITVDATSTRGQWVTSYSNKWVNTEPVDHWLPTGPTYLDLGALEEGYKAHMIVMHDSSSWLSSNNMINRLFKR